MKTLAAVVAAWWVTLAVQAVLTAYAVHPTASVYTAAAGIAGAALFST